MSAETELREAFAEVGAQAPEAGPIFDRIVVGSSARRRKRRIAYVAGVCVAVVAIVIPGSLWLTRSSPTRPTHPGGGLPIAIAPTWLPGGFVETGRSYDSGGLVSRTFGKGSAWISITDGAFRDETWKQGGSVVVDGRHGALTSSKTDIAAELQVPWHSGRLLEVQVQQVRGARATALRVAQSVRSAPAVSVGAPLTCTDPLCRSHSVDIGGVRNKWEATVGGPGANASLTFGYGGPPSDVKVIRQLNVNGRSAVLWQAGMQGSGMFIDLGGKRSIMIGLMSRAPLTRAEAIRVAKSVHLNGHPTYRWLGTRPY